MSTPEAQALVELAERCEAATGADRNLDGLIYCAINPGATTVVDHEPGRFPRKAIVGPISVVMDRIGGKDGADYLSAPAYTASLDAAMSLVPDDWNVILRGCNDSWHVAMNATASGPLRQAFGFAQSAALAVAAAALRALASLDKLGGVQGEGVGG